MGGKRKRKNVTDHRRIHPRNKYSDNPPDFALLSSLYPTFQPYVFYSRDGRPKIDWTDFNATRELTRVLLLHDHGIKWWIPDGQLCPTVPNRLNYIHWIEDLLSSNIIPDTRTDDEVIKGFDIGTGANCIYPLLGASVLGWKFVGSDITDVAIEWANQNVQSNPHIAELIEIRKVATEDKKFVVELEHRHNHSSETDADSNTEPHDNGLESSSVLETRSGVTKSYDGPPILLGAVKDGEYFDFCMCNPPFFDTMEEAGLNPRTSCGGTPEEMVSSGGEHAFISRIIEDSVQLKHTFRWYTSMVGRKLNLNSLVSELWNAGATVVKTTEFVQGRTSRWGLAWSFLPPLTKLTSSRMIEENNLSFMLEGLQRQHSAFHVLQSVELYLAGAGASCKLDATAFNVDITASKDQIDIMLKTEAQNKAEDANCHHELNISNASDALRFRILVFQQIPGTLLVRGKLLEKASSIAGSFPLIFRKLESVLNNKFRSGRVLADRSSSRHVK